MSGALKIGRCVAVLGGRSEIAAAILDSMREVNPELEAILCVKGARGDEVEFDAGVAGSSERALTEAADRMGGLDCVIVAFGVLGSGDEHLEDPAAIRHNAMVNMAAACEAGTAAALALRACGGGDLVYLSSIAGVRPRGSMPAYSSSKSGADGFYQAASGLWKAWGVRTCVVRPGFVRTKMTKDLKARRGSVGPEAVGRVTVEALRHGEANSIVYTSRVLRLIGTVMRIVPGFLWRKVGG